jgi:hypothetical protein
VRQRVIRVELDRFFKRDQRLGQRSGRELIPKIPATQIGIKSLRVICAAFAKSYLTGFCQLRQQRLGYFG